MECFIQYLDDLEDFIYAIALTWERVRTKVRFIAFIVLAAFFQVFAVILALRNSPLALAVSCLLLVALLYRGAVSPAPIVPHTV
jgi:hypothetical protein